MKNNNEDIKSRLTPSSLDNFLNSGIREAEIAPEAIRLNIASGTVKIIMRISDSIDVPNFEAR